MRAFIFDYFNGTTGEQELFTDEQKAIKEYDYTLSHLTNNEKAKLEFFRLFEIEATDEQIQDIQENGYNEDNGTQWIRDIKNH